jgi:hypothetical protein
MKVWFSFLVIFLLVSINCMTKSIFMLDNKNGQAKETILKYIPIGSSDSFAKKIMEENQFTCKKTFKGEFLDYKNIDYLYCDRYDRKSFWISRRWQIALILKENQIKDIQTATDLLGP